MRISDWSSDVCSSDLYPARRTRAREACGYIQGLKRRERPFVARLPGNYRPTTIDVETRQPPVESLCRSRRFFDADAGPVPQVGQGGCVSHSKKTRQSTNVPLSPRLRPDLRPDDRRAPPGSCEGGTA